MRVQGQSGLSGGQTTGAGGTDARFNQMLANLERLQNVRDEKNMMVSALEARKAPERRIAESRLA
jgi:hypothetical protein